jgi:hypothetical protein
MPAAPGASSEDASTDHHDVAVVGGGPAGCAAAIFTARYGLDTVVYDAGPSSLRRCAYLQNYLGFPGGVGVETFLDLAHAQVREAGGTVDTVRVQRVERAELDDREQPDASDAPFVLERQDGVIVAADRVIAATRSGGEYLRPLGGDAMFAEHEHDGEIHEHFDPDYADADGRTPIDGLYVASPAGERDVQAIVAAGQGAHVARRLLADRRRARGYPEGLDEVYDWLRPEAEFAGDWGDRDGWREYFESRLPEDADPDDPISGTDGAPGAEVEPAAADGADAVATLRDLREAYVDHAMPTRRSPEAIDRLTGAGVERLVEVYGPERLLGAIDDEAIEAHLADRAGTDAEVAPDG